MMSERSSQEAGPTSAEPSAVSAQFRLIPGDFGGAPNVYANFAQTTLSQHDLTLFLGWYATPILETAPDEAMEVPVRPLMAVSLPLTMLRPLIAILESASEAWEQANTQQLANQQMEIQADNPETT